jgi:hypothetical protein
MPLAEPVVLGPGWTSLASAAVTGRAWFVCLSQQWGGSLLVGWVCTVPVEFGCCVGCANAIPLAINAAASVILPIICGASFGSNTLITMVTFRAHDELIHDGLIFTSMKKGQ